VRRLGGIAVILLIMAGALAPAVAGEKFITIGTASEGGVYYPAGGAICRLVRRGIKEHGIRCFANATSGSVYNLKALRDGELDIAIAQTDWLYHAYKGTRDFKDAGPDKALRSIFSLHTEAFTVLARADSGIKTIHDLKHKRIGIAADGSGMLATAEEFIKAEGWTRDSFAAMPEFKPVELGKALCEGTVDAILVTTGHPNGNTQDTTSKCATHLIPVEGEEIEKMIHDNPYYVHITLPGHMYPGSPAPVSTFGVKATLVTTRHVDDDIIYEVVKAVFSNLDNFKTLHPVFSSLDKEKMVQEGLIVPLHPGALRYYREVGLIK
jgi:TRAP transporter TAXI family solute receptor